MAELQDRGWLLVADGNHGEYRPRPGEFGEGEWAFIRAADLDDAGNVLFEHAQRINDVARQRIRTGVGAAGDVLLSHKGTVGKVAFAPDDSAPFVCSPQTTFWRSLNQDEIDRRFLYFFLRSAEFQQQLAAREGETDMAPYVSLTAQRQLHVLLPRIESQRTIAGILGALDDAIALNRRMNRTLEATAAALFRSWFVEFDPVIAKADRRRAFGVPHSAQQAMPSALTESELGPIPEGWSVEPIGDLVKCVGGSTPSTTNGSFWNEGRIRWATPKDLAGLEVPVIISPERRITEAGLQQIGSGLLPRGTVLLSSRAPIGYLAVAAEPMAVNQGFIAMVCDGALPNWYVLHWAHQNMESISARANGTTFMEISKRSFRPILALRPSCEILAAFFRIVEPLHLLIEKNVRESQTLIAIRDALLPQLLSGAIRLRKAEQLTVGAAV